MLIDFHTHIFPDKIADTILAGTEASTGLPAKFEGTERGLRQHMARSGTDLSVVLAVAPSAMFVKKVNDWLLSIRDEHLEVFGAIHPDLEDWPEELVKLKRAGIRGIKFNSLFQKLPPDDQKLYPIYQAMVNLKLTALFHAGASFKDRHNLYRVLASPQSIARVAQDFPQLKVIAAHYGGNHMLEQMKKHLLGKDVFFDTAYPPDLFALDRQEVADIIRAHGPKKILFGTDFPWETQDRGIAYIESLPLTRQEKEMILGGNAQQILFG